MNEENDRIEDTSATTRPRWQEVDAWGVRLGGRLGDIDVEVGEWLLAARDEEVHRHLGYGTFAEYTERRAGLSAHATAALAVLTDGACSRDPTVTAIDAIHVAE